MKVALDVCMALLAIVLVQAEDEMAPPVLAAGTRIGNARPAAPRQMPYMARIKGWRYCSGSLITRSAVLTGAWCLLYADTFTVRLGSIYPSGKDPKAWSVVSTRAMKHPKYNFNNYDSNIAIIFLPKQAPVNEFIQPVYLPCSPVDSSYIGRQGIVSGWGWTSDDPEWSNVLSWTEVVVIPDKYCKKFRPSSAITDGQLCGASYPITTYYDDLGAPLVLYTRGKYILIGIRSMLTDHQYNGSHPVVYTRVTPFIDWIKVNTESD